MHKVTDYKAAGKNTLPMAVMDAEGGTMALPRDRGNGPFCHFGLIFGPRTAYFRYEIMQLALFYG